MENRKSFYRLVCSFYLIALLGFGGVIISKTAQANEKKQETVKKKKSDEKAGNFARGSKLWANRCSQCHNMRDPKDLSDDQWKATVTHMRLRAGLTGQDMRDILEFLQKVN